MAVQTQQAVDHAFAAVRLALWSNAVLGGAASLDEAADAVATDGMHRIAGLPGEDGLTTIAVGIGRLRAAGATHVTAALPVPGDAAGIAGPRPLTEAAVAAGHAVLVAGVRPLGAPPDRQLALVARAVDGMSCWETYDANPAPPPCGEREAGRILRETVLAAADELAALDAAPFDAGRRDAIEATVRAASPGSTPTSVDPTSRRLYADASRLWLVSLVALRDDGGTVSTTASERRRSSLRAVESAARHALMAVAAAPRTRTT